MSTYTLFDDLQDQQAVESFLAREADRHADLHARALAVIHDQYVDEHVAPSWSESSYQEVLANDQAFSEKFQVKYPALATWLSSCGFRFAGMFFAPMLLVTDQDSTDEILSLMVSGTSAAF
jgi:hypothetical protein